MAENIPKVSKRISTGMKFFLAVIFVYLGISIFNSTLTQNAIIETLRMFTRIIPMLVIVFIIMIVVNLYIDSGKIKKHLGEEAGLKGWFNATIAGILISGPPYVLYPLLKDLKKSGMKDSLLAVFLFNRNVKIPFIPVMIFYFGLGYTVLFSGFIIIFSILNGLLIERILKKIG